MIPVPETQVIALNTFQYIWIAAHITVFAIASCCLHFRETRSLEEFIKDHRVSIKKCECGAVYYEIPDDAKYVSPYIWFQCTGIKSNGEECGSTLTIKVDDFREEETKDQILNNCWATKHYIKGATLARMWATEAEIDGNKAAADAYRRIERDVIESYQEIKKRKAS
jgi:hypothetical protein